MSEEILRALMQLFAIITKQDEGASAGERVFVEYFLKQQLSSEVVKDYIALYDSFLTGDQQEEKPGEESAKKKLTNVKDSVRTLSICKKINKTLTQKQKVIVLIRLYELINSSSGRTPQRMQIIDTVATVFNIDQEEYKLIEKFCLSEEPSKELDFSDVLLVIPSHNSMAYEHAKCIISDGLHGDMALVHIKSVDMFFIRYLGSVEVLMNGYPIHRNQIYLFASGSTLRLAIGEPIYYSDIVSRFLADSDIQKLSFNAEELAYTFPNGKVGLRNINISEGAGKLVGLMGGSGAGKTTLLNVLAGLEKPSSGKVLVNGIDIHREKDRAEGIIGYVAQDDILFEELTVFQNLYYNAKLCLGNLAEAELVQKVDVVLKSLGLFEIKEIKVGNVLNKKISGGQRKRLNIALELIREPSILFLDEPTSGLSSRDSENVVDLLKELSLKGKLIFVVIHQPSSDIYKMFDKMIILDVGGFQIYYGNPVEAVMYFKRITNQINSDIGQCHTCGNVNPELIFNTIDAKVVDEYGNLTESRKNSPQRWREYFLTNPKPDKTEDVLEEPPRSLFIPTLFKQLGVFVTRDFLSKISNTQYLLVNLLEAPILALVLAFIIRYVDNPAKDSYHFGNNENIPAYLFMCIIVALFMGLTVSAEEIIRDAKILKRESFLNLSRLSYLTSKVALLFLLSAIQTFLFVVIGNAILGINGMTISYWMLLFSCSCCANLIGLNISSTFNSAVTIYILIPILLIPQMILSGAIFSFDKLNKLIGNVEKVPVIADVMTSRWAYEAIAVKQFRDNSYEKHFYNLEKEESNYDFKQVYWYPHMHDKLDQSIEFAGKTDEASTKVLDENLVLFRNEIKKTQEIELVKTKPHFNLDTFSVKTTSASYTKVKEFLDTLKMEYAGKFAQANTLKDNMISSVLKDTVTAKLFSESKKSNYNQTLADLVKKFDNKHRIMEYQGRLLQIYDPIYLSPEVRGRFALDYRTHLYAPQKPLFGKLFDTFTFNILVIWLMTAVFFVTLYANLLRKVLELPTLITTFKQKKE
jgi:ABC transport system ATP-binding/permease protein